MPPARLKALRFLCQTLCSLTQPFAPHMACELWELLGGEKLWAVPWPVSDDTYLARDTQVIVVQVNGKLRARIEVPSGADKDAVIAAARAAPNARRFLDGKTIVKEIAVPGKLVNMVVR